MGRGGGAVSFVLCLGKIEDRERRQGRVRKE